MRSCGVRLVNDVADAAGPSMLVDRAHFLGVALRRGNR